MRRRLRGLKRQALINACLRLRPTAIADAEECTRRTVMQRLARRIRDLTDEVHAADAELSELVDEHVGRLLQMRGVGVIAAAQYWVSWSDPAASATRPPSPPWPASVPSRPAAANTRHRLNPFGDRALHQSALTLERCDPETQNYLARRTGDGKTRRKPSAASSATAPSNTRHQTHRLLSTT